MAWTRGHLPGDGMMEVESLGPIRGVRRERYHHAGTSVREISGFLNRLTSQGLVAR